jgi:hypothetical protein
MPDDMVFDRVRGLLQGPAIKNIEGQENSLGQNDGGNVQKHMHSFENEILWSRGKIQHCNTSILFELPVIGETYNGKYYINYFLWGYTF